MMLVTPAELHAAYELTEIAAATGVSPWRQGNALELELLGHPIPQKPTLDRLRRMGIPNATIDDTQLGLREIRARFFDQGRFEFAIDDDEEGAEPALLVLERNWHEEVVDAVAWPLGHVGAPATLLGIAAFLGERALTARMPLFRGPLRVFRAPSTWLQAAGNGLVLLDPELARQRLRDLDVELLAEDEAHARELDAALTSTRPWRLLYPPRHAA